MVGNALTSSTGRSQSRAIGDVVAPVALLSGIALSPESPVRYGRHRRNVVISLLSPSLALLGLGLPLLFTSPYGRIGWHPTASLFGWHPTAATPWASVPF